MMWRRISWIFLHSISIAVIVAAAYSQLWCWWNVVTGDAISYLDIARLYEQGDWHNALNSYWCPLYSWLLAALFKVIPPEIDTEFFLVHCLNFAIFLFALGSHVLLMSALWRMYLKETEPLTEIVPMSRNVFFLCGYSVFLYSFFVLGGMGYITPDLLMSALMLLATWQAVEILLRPDQTFRYVFLGLLLGLSYLAKAVAFPISAVFYLSMFFSLRGVPSASRKLILAAAVQLLVMAPFVTAISLKYGYFTYSDMVKVSQKWVMRESNFQDRGPSYLHPTRVLSTSPRVYEFDAPLNVTYAPWFDPVYWNAGAPYYVKIETYLRCARENTPSYWLFIGGFVVGLLLVSSLSQRKFCLTASSITANALIIFPSAVAFGGYYFVALISSDPRYFSAFAELFFLGLFMSLRLVRGGKSVRRTLILTAIAGSVPFWFAAGIMHGLDQVMAAQNRRTVQQEVASLLRSAGLQPGDKVVHLGSFYHSWAHLAGLKIIAEIREDVNMFWALPREKQEALVEKFKALGAKAVVQDPKLDVELNVDSVRKLSKEWVPVKGSTAVVRIIN
ncbi:hypothetical protein BH10CYA1_BH10CYA1_19900 [soil metagenome]